MKKREGEVLIAIQAKLIDCQWRAVLSLAQTRSKTTLHPMCQQPSRSHKVLDVATQKRSGFIHRNDFILVVDSLHDDVLGNRIIQHHFSTINLVEAGATCSDAST